MHRSLSETKRSIKWNDMPGRLNSPVLKAISILLRVVQEEAPISLADLSAAVGFPKPTVHRLALLLEQEGLLQKDPLSRRYLVGSALEGLAFNAIRNAPGHSIRRFHMQRLSEKIGESINLGALSGDEVVYVERVESAWPLRMDFKPGSRVPIHCTANGKLLLAYSPPSVRQRILRAAPFPACAKNTLTTAAQLSRELEAIRRRGYSEDNEEFLAGVCCVAVPIRNGKREVIAGLAVMAPSARFPLEKARSYLPDLYATAELISTHMLIRLTPQGPRRRVLGGAPTGLPSNAPGVRTDSMIGQPPSLLGSEAERSS